MEFFLSILLLIFSFYVLYISSESIINNGSLVATAYKLSPIVIGVTIIAIGTSLPELLVSIYSIIFLDNTQASNMIIGNILGSNIANISLVLGFCGLFYKIFFKDDILYDLLFISLLGSYVIFCIYNEIIINYLHGSVLIVIFYLYLYNLIKKNKLTEDSINNESFSLFKVAVKIFISILGISFATKVAVDSAIDIANIIGLDKLAISLTVVAIGTSLPELFASFVALKKKKYSMLIGNIIGSNIINIVFVLGFSSLFVNIEIISSNKNLFYLYITFILSHFVLIFSYLYNKVLYRFYGFILLLFYLFFLYQLFLIRV
jgi:cation:H+ antiporter